MDSIEDILPVKTEDERRAERQLSRAERLAERNAAIAMEANKPPPSTVLLAPPTAQSVASFLVERPDSMFHLWIWDWDTYQGNLRVLYTTQPDRVQFAQADWALHVYVGEISQDGELTQHQVTSKQANDHAALALRHGFDEIFLQRDSHVIGEPEPLERWSISDQRLLSSVDVGDITVTIDDKQWEFASFRMATSDGNLLYDASIGGSRRGDPSQFAWFKLSPEGNILGGAAATTIEDNIGSSSTFHTTNGGGGFVVNLSRPMVQTYSAVLEFLTLMQHFPTERRRM